jgi:hypothetical protein
MKDNYFLSYLTTISDYRYDYDVDHTEYLPSLFEKILDISLKKDDITFLSKNKIKKLKFI